MDSITQATAEGILSGHRRSFITSDMFCSMIRALDRFPDIPNRLLVSAIRDECPVSQHEASSFIRQYRD